MRFGLLSLFFVSFSLTTLCEDIERVAFVIMGISFIVSFGLGMYYFKQKKESKKVKLALAIFIVLFALFAIVYLHPQLVVDLLSTEKVYLCRGY